MRDKKRTEDLVTFKTGFKIEKNNANVVQPSANHGSTNVLLRCGVSIVFL